MGGNPPSPPPPPPPPPPPAIYSYGNPSNTIIYKGNIYATLDNSSPFDSGAGCQSGYASVPSGWNIARNNADSSYVIGSYSWGTHVLITSDGCSYGTKNLNNGGFWSCGTLAQYSYGFMPNYCNYRILISTPNPTQAPTPVPISDPTFAPSPKPVSNPTHAPTDAPVPNPTFVPTLKPTLAPRARPTKAPVASPTFQPTEEPTHDPTLEPSARPSKEPTQEPTHDPTHEPSAVPSKEPTLEPSAKPSKEPTLEPTRDPTLEPTARPSKEPTLAPTKKPVAEPTFAPTLKPTPVPTDKPIVSPTKSPTFEPSVEPSPHPTLVPTFAPSTEPSQEPTKRPVIYIPRTSNPTQPPVPTYEPTTVPLIGKNFCTFSYVKKINDNKLSDSVDVEPGCALFSSDDFDFLSPGAVTKVLYVCSVKGTPVQITSDSLSKIGLNDELTEIIPGDGTSVTLFNGRNFDGSKIVFSSKWHPSLASAHFPDSSEGNDDVQSIVLITSVQKFEMPSICNRPESGSPK